MIAADLLFEYLANCGVEDVFTVSGGGCMHLLDALGRNPRLRYWSNHHEQASAYAAEAYSRITGNLGVCLVTTGPGSTNALSALGGAWVDSIPVVVVSGQVRTDLIADYSRHRQIGHQEIDIISMASPITKYAGTVTAEDDLLEEIKRAVAIAKDGRPGPVWLNVPLDLQSRPVDDARISETACAPRTVRVDPAVLAEGTELVARLLAESRRPVVVAGYGIHLAGAEHLFEEFVDSLGCPVVTTIAGMDLLYEQHPLYMGRFGPTGLRRANFTVQNADLLIAVGASMSVGAIGFDTSGFAPKATSVMVNIDPEEMDKPNFKADYGVVCDAGSFMTAMVERARTQHFEFDPKWVPATQELKSKFPLVGPEYLTDPEHVNSYVLANEISKLMREGEVMLTGNGLDAVSVFHSFAVKPNQRVMANSNFGAMGWDLPAAIGACVARDGARTVLMCGDGSVQMNIQELMTIGHNRLNVKVFVLNNGGYESIRATQTSFFEGRLVGCEKGSGVANPDFAALAKAYGLGYVHLGNNGDIAAGLQEIMESDAPYLCEVNVSYLQEKTPKIISRRLADGSFQSCSLDDQYPFLPAEERAEIDRMFASE